MLTSALALLRERGANGVTLDAVLAHSGAPRGSIYHDRRQRPATGERLARVWRTGVRHDLACPPTQQFVLKDLLTGKR